ncbi:unnamed protein product [Hapterophycus canaliculatus]
MAEAAAPAAETAIASGIQTITLGAGCFWCVEAVYQRVVGVESVESGYMGGTVKNPSYGQICTGETGHAEVIQLKYDASKVSATDLLEIFFKMHDPTTKNRQGADVGTQYRSVVFYHAGEQKRAAEEVIEAVQPKFGSKIVTEVVPASDWYPADKGHQDYYSRNKSSNGYCRLVIHPKLSKVKHAKYKSPGIVSKVLGALAP